METDLDIKVSGTYKDYHTLLTKSLDHLQSMLQNFKMKCLALLNKHREYFQCNSGDLVYLISPLTTQLRTSSRKVAINYNFSGIQNCRPTQLLAHDNRWKTVKVIV